MPAVTSETGWVFSIGPGNYPHPRLTITADQLVHVDIEDVASARAAFKKALWPKYDRLWSHQYRADYPRNAEYFPGGVVPLKDALRDGETP